MFPDIVFKTGVSVIIAVFCFRIYNYVYQKRYFKFITKKKREQVQEKKDALWAKLQSLNNHLDGKGVTNMSVEELVEKMDSGEFDPLDVLHCFQREALIKDKEYNFITDLNPHAESDALTSMTMKGSLSGVPISIKDYFFVKDCDCTVGMPSLCLQPASEDSVIVRSLRKHGAVPFVMTNMAQAGMAIETSNPIFGQTLNPHNKERTCGGSSGGEGAILSSGASVIGLGNDIGGSVRIPCSYCGLYGLKPTAQRISDRNIINLYPFQNIINVSSGPMARRFEDLVTVFKAMCSRDMFDLDPRCPPLSFNQNLFSSKRPLKIGYYFRLSELQVAPVPAVVRAVRLAKTALEKAGHELVEFEIPRVDDAIFDLYFRCLFNDGGYGFMNSLIKDNPVDSSISLTVMMMRIPRFCKLLLSYLIFPFNRGYSHGLHQLAGVPSVFELWRLKDRILEYQEEVLRSFQSTHLDGLICPVLPITAPPCLTSKYIMDVVAYTGLYNLLDYPAGSVPVTRVNEDDLQELRESYPRDSLTHRQIIDSQKGSLHMPVGVQCVSLPWAEELCLRIMGDVVKNLTK